MRTDAGLALALVALVAALLLRAWPAPAYPGVLVEVAGDVERPGVHRLSHVAVAGGTRVVVRGDEATFGAAEDPLLFGKRVDLNTASAGTLTTLPGIGPALAERIVGDRAVRGPFYATGDLQRARGIGPATLAGFAGLVTVGDVGPRPPPPRLDPNTASERAWQAVRGIGPVTAAAIVADREHNGPFESCEALTRVHGVGPATVARVRAVAVCP